MVEIASVQANTPAVDEARALLIAYGEFLRTIESSHAFDFAGFREEIAGLAQAGSIYLAKSIERAFSPWIRGGTATRPLARAGIGRAFGPKCEVPEQTEES